MRAFAKKKIHAFLFDIGKRIVLSLQICIIPALATDDRSLIGSYRTGNHKRIRKAIISLEAGGHIVRFKRHALRNVQDIKVKLRMLLDRHQYLHLKRRHASFTKVVGLIGDIGEGRGIARTQPAFNTYRNSSAIRKSQFRSMATRTGQCAV